KVLNAKVSSTTLHNMNHPTQLDPLTSRSFWRFSIARKLIASATSVAMAVASSGSIQTASAAPPARDTAVSIDRDSFALNAELEDAATYNLAAPDPHDSTCLPDLAEPGEVIRGKTVYGLTSDWDPTRPGDNNVFT